MLNLRVSRSLHTHTHKTAPHSSKSPLLSLIGVPVCATLACWQVSSMFQSKSEWSLQMDQIPANPKGDICKGPKPKVNGSRRILEELPMLPPPLEDVIALVAGSLRASSFQSGGCHFLGLWVSLSPRRGAKCGMPEAYGIRWERSLSAHFRRRWFSSTF